MTDFKLVTGLITPEESVKMFNYMNASKVKEGHINFDMFKSIPAVLAVLYPERLNEVIKQTKEDPEQRPNFDKLKYQTTYKVKLKDSDNEIEKLKVMKINKMERLKEVGTIELADFLLEHINPQDDPSNMK